MTLFLDTSYILVLINTSDQFHARAASLARQIHDDFVTTDAVLLEVGNSLSRIPWRAAAVSTLHAIREDDSIEVIPINSNLMDRAIELFANRPDKNWGLIDCTSFVVMQERELTVALSADKHFTQAGFTALLLDN